MKIKDVITEGAYDDGVNDGIRGEPNRRASSIYGPSTGEYDRGYAVGLKKGEEQRQARIAQARADEAPYEKMSTEELEQMLADIQQRTTARQQIYTKLRGSSYSFDPKHHLPPNHAELAAQGKEDHKAWNIIHQVLGQRKRQGMAEGAEFGAYYYEQLAQKVFDANPDLDNEDAILNAGYKIAIQDLDSKSRANHLFTWDEDFPSDFVSAYGWLKKNNWHDQHGNVNPNGAYDAGGHYHMDRDMTEDWQKVNKRDKTDGMSRKAVKAYRREHPGSKLKTAVTTKPSKLKKGSKSAKRRKSFCARMSGMKKAHASAKTKRDPNSPINKALRRWNCESVEDMRNLIEYAEQVIREEKVRLDPKCWKGKKIGNPKTKMKGGVRVNNCVPAESVNEAGSPAQQAAIAIAMKKKGQKPKNEN